MDSSDNKDGLRKELSDEKFIAWSKGTSERSYDVQSLIEHLQKAGHAEAIGLDIGGGIGAFAKAVAESCTNPKVSITVVDPGVDALDQKMESPNVEYQLAPFDESYPSDQKFDFIIFRTVLHHLISDSEKNTYETQIAALSKAKSMLKDDGIIFVTENFYEPMFGNDLTSRIIYAVTSSNAVAWVARKLGANTAGEGVRFRSSDSWKQLQDTVGLEVVDSLRYTDWGGANMPFWQRLPLLCKERFQAVQVLKPAGKDAAPNA